MARAGRGLGRRGLQLVRRARREPEREAQVRLADVGARPALRRRGLGRGRRAVLGQQHQHPAPCTCGAPGTGACTSRAAATG